MQKQNSFLTQRAQMFAAGFGFWALLAFWCISAFWQHVEATKPAYLWPARIGACSAEFVILVMVFLHCFSKHINVRKWALILGTALAVVAVAHTAGLRGLDEATAKQTETQERLGEQLTKMSERQMQGTKRKADVAKSAQKELADVAREGNEKVKDSSIFPRWYLDGWMYGVMFALSALALAIPLGMMGNRLDIDANFDGVADHEQERRGRWVVQLEEARQQLPTKAMTGEFPRELEDGYRYNGEVPATGRLENEPGKAPRR